jgi:hypothetical protein
MFKLGLRLSTPAGTGQSRIFRQFPRRRERGFITLSFTFEKECEFHRGRDSDNWNVAPLRLFHKLTAILAFAS